MAIIDGAELSRGSELPVGPLGSNNSFTYVGWLDSGVSFHEVPFG